MFKIVQYSNVAISNLVSRRDEKTGKKILKLSQTSRDARICFSGVTLFSTFNQLKTFLQVPRPVGSCTLDRALRFTQLVTQLGATTFDNATLYSRNTVLNPENEKRNDQIMSYFWSVTILCTAALNLRKAKNLKKNEDPKKKTKNPKEDEKIDLQKKIYYVGTISELSDLITAFAGTNILPRYFGWNFTPIMKGLGGTIAGATGIYNFKLNQKLNALESTKI